MALDISAEFATLKDLEGYDVVFLVEFPGLNLFYATQEPGFTGPWLADNGLINTSRILCNADIPAYETLLKPLRNSGIGSLTTTLDPAGFARTGSGSVTFLNQGGLSSSLDNFNLNNALVRIRVGFNGSNLGDYQAIFLGVVDTYTATAETVDMVLIDDTQRLYAPVPAQTDAEFFPRSISNKAIPIILGDVANISAIPLYGPVSGTLAFPANTFSTYILLSNPIAKFPPTGTVEIVNFNGTNIQNIPYSAVSIFPSQNNLYTRLDLVGNLSYTFTVGSAVALNVAKPYEYLLGFLGREPRNTQIAGVYSILDPIVAPADPSGFDARQVIKFTSATEVSTSLVTTVSGAARGPNLITPVWTSTSGSLTVTNQANGLTKVDVGTLVDQAIPSVAYQDIPVTPGAKYQLSFRFKNISGLFADILLGTVTTDSAYYSFNELNTTVAQIYSVVVQPVESPLRLSVVVTNFSPPHAATHVELHDTDLYDISTENPAVQLRHLVETHMGGIVLHEGSLAESANIWAGAGDRLAGIIQQTEEDQSLLGRILQQFRSTTFLNETGQQKIVTFDPSRIPAYAVTTNHVHRGSMKLGRTALSGVYTSFYVYYGRSPSVQATGDLGGRLAFTGVSFCTPTETNHSTEPGLPLLCDGTREKFRLERTLEIFADMIPDPITAENLLSYIVRRFTHQRYTASFTSYLNMAHVETADFITIRHPLFPSSLQGSRFEVLEKVVEPNGVFTHWSCQEINPFAFGGYKEKWEPPVLVSTRSIIFDHWNLPEDALPTDRPCNGITERWNPVNFNSLFTNPLLNRFVAHASGTSLLLSDGYRYNTGLPGKREGSIIAKLVNDNTQNVDPLFIVPSRVCRLLAFTIFADPAPTNFPGIEYRGYFGLVATVQGPNLSLQLVSRSVDRYYGAPDIELAPPVFVSTTLVETQPFQIRFRWACSDDTDQPLLSLIGEYRENDAAPWSLKTLACFNFGKVPSSVAGSFRLPFFPYTIIPTSASADIFAWSISDEPLDGQGRTHLPEPVEQVVTVRQLGLTEASFYGDDTELYTITGMPTFEGWPRLNETAEEWEPTPLNFGQRIRSLLNYRKW